MCGRSIHITKGRQNSNQITREKEITVINIAKYVSFMFFMLCCIYVEEKIKR